MITLDYIRGYITGYMYNVRIPKELILINGRVSGKIEDIENKGRVFRVWYPSPPGSKMFWHNLLVSSEDDLVNLKPAILKGYKHRIRYQDDPTPEFPS